MGNVRLSYFKNTNGSAEVLEKNDYYPFGLKHNANVISFGDSSYSYQYNGKEYQKETGWSDYGARMYMPDIARWGVIDPLAETSRRFNPYNYAYNNPISFIDPDGRKALAVDEGWSWNVSTSSGWFNERRNFGSFEEFIKLTSSNEREKGSGGGSGSTPKNSTGPGLVGILVNFWGKLFGTSKRDAKISTFLSGATITRASLQVGTAEGAFETTLNWEKILAATGTIASGGRWLLPLMLNGDSSNARGYDIPLTGATDVPADESGNLYLYRNMRSVNGMPMVGEGLDKLGLRDRDVNLLSNSTMITPLFANGLSVTAGYDDVIPPNIPDFSRGKGTIFRIPASSLISYGLVGLPVPNPNVPNYGQIRPAIPMNVGTFRALIQSTAPAWQPVK